MAAKKVQGAKSSNIAYTFDPQEIEALAVEDQKVRFGTDQDHVDELAKSIASKGQRTPCLIRLDVNNNPILVAGRHRRLAVLQINNNLKSYGLTEPLALKATLITADDEESLQAAYDENTGLKLSIVDLAVAAAAFQAQHEDWDSQRIAEAMSHANHKVTRQMAARLLRIARMPKAIKDALHTNKIKVSTANHLAKLPDESAMIASLNEILDGAKKEGDAVKAIKETHRAKKRAAAEEADNSMARNEGEFWSFVSAVGSPRAKALEAFKAGNTAMTVKRMQEVLSDGPLSDDTMYLIAGLSSVTDEEESGSVDETPGATIDTNGLSDDSDQTDGDDDGSGDGSDGSDGDEDDTDVVDLSNSPFGDDDGDGEDTDDADDVKD